MNSKFFLGLALMLAGLVAFAHEAFSFIAQQQWLDQMAVERSNPLPFSPAFGAIAMFAGFVLIALPKGERLRSRS
jgi:Flp pilus assembly protein protease CpaA